MATSEHETTDTVKRAEKKLALIVAEAADALYVKAREGFLKSIPDLENRIRAIDHKLPVAAHNADDLSRRLKKALDLAEDMEKRELAPFKKAAEMVKERWTGIVASLKNLRALAAAKREDALSFEREQQERERKAREAELEAARKAEAEAKTATERQDALANLRTKRVAVDELPPAGAPMKLRTEDGHVTTQTTVWTWELLNIDDVPREYLQLDRGKITAAVRGQDGKREIAGLRIFEKKGMAEK